MKYLKLVILLFCINSSYAQYNRDSLLYYDILDKFKTEYNINFNHYDIINDTLYGVQSFNNKLLNIIDTIRLDTVSKDELLTNYMNQCFKSIQPQKNSCLVFLNIYPDSLNRLRLYNITKFKYVELGTYNNVWIGHNQSYIYLSENEDISKYTDSYDSRYGELDIGGKRHNIYSYNIFTKKKDFLYRLEDHSDDLYSILWVVGFDNCDTLLFDLGEIGAGSSYESKRIFLFDKKKKEIIDTIKTITTLYMPTYFSNFVVLNNEKLFDQNLNFISTIPSISLIKEGHIIKNNKIQYYIAESRDYNRKSIYVNFPDNINFILAASDIYDNKKLSRERLKELNQYDLWLLKNFVFARHQYKFDNPYLQSFYKIFYFYGFKTKFTKNISLTPIDKQNLKIILEARKKARKGI